jgi:cystathionine beta-lyase/cystathionine gamma-synthase
MRTFAVRMREHNNNALTVARWLETHDMVERVYYPFLKSHPQHTLALEQMKGGSGMISFELKGGRDTGMILLQHIKLLQQAVF